MIKEKQTTVILEIGYFAESKKLSDFPFYNIKDAKELFKVFEYFKKSFFMFLNHNTFYRINKNILLLMHAF